VTGPVGVADVESGSASQQAPSSMRRIVAAMVVAMTGRMKFLAGVGPDRGMAGTR